MTLIGEINAENYSCLTFNISIENMISVTNIQINTFLFLIYLFSREIEQIHISPKK